MVLAIPLVFLLSYTPWRYPGGPPTLADRLPVALEMLSLCLGGFCLRPKGGNFTGSTELWPEDHEAWVRDQIIQKVETRRDRLRMVRIFGVDDKRYDMWEEAAFRCAQHAVKLVYYKQLINTFYDWEEVEDPINWDLPFIAEGERGMPVRWPPREHGFKRVGNAWVREDVVNPLVDVEEPEGDSEEDYWFLDEHVDGYIAENIGEMPEPYKEQRTSVLEEEEAPLIDSLYL